MPYRILLRRDNSVTWTYNDPVLMTGEPGYETDTGRLKIGNGQSPWSDLNYYSGVTGTSITISGTPTNTSTPVGWGKIDIDGTDYWVSLYQ
jgi:hypothetical protein